ncbi:peptide chain release factor N(5)-glutamine methyltransferase [Candidatus Daviesbacteria bacterium]|nr:peptide chain release factor N(5)-glutamine methyltransferase [Candidatus Daviesbacteria bacterium]
MISSKPSQYTNGCVEFCKLKFKVNPDVLIPRPETELLVDEVLKFISLLPTTYYQLLTILDVGTGSGNIAISLASHSSSGNVKIIATDVSEKALKIAKQNAKFHKVENRIKFIQSNLLSNLRLHPKGVRLIIVTNLPYIPSARIPYLDSSVKDFEPHVALDGGEDGFELYRKLFQQIQDKGWKPKLIIGEIDYTHGELAALEAQKYFPNAQIEVKKDLAHLQRILIIRQLL